MAKWILLNTVRHFKNGNGPVKLFAGETLDDTQISVTNVQAAGGVVVPSSNVLATAAQKVAQKRKNQGASEEELDAIMATAVAAESDAFDTNRVSTNGAAGATVAAGAAISAACTITPKTSGTVKVRAWVSAQGLGAGATFTPVLKQGTTTIAAPAQHNGAATTFPYNAWVELEVTGLTVGTAVTFNWVSTAGDGTVTLGNGATGKASGLTVEEKP